MGYGKKRGRSKRRSSRKRKRSKRTYKVSVGKLADRRVNTLIEHRMQAIAKQEIKKSIVKLYDRNYYFGTVNKESNCVTGGRRIFYDGIVQRICQIDKQDINQVLNAPDHEPDDAKMQEEVDADGAVQGMLTQTSHGRRQTELVKIDGFTVSIKAFMDRCPNEFDHSTMGPNGAGNTAWHQWFLRRPNGEYDRILPETIIVKWAIVRVYDDQAQLAPLIQTVPTVDSICPFRPWGYTAVLDDDQYLETKLIKKRVLCKGSFSFRADDTRNKDKTINYYRGFKTPLSVKYLPADQNGQQAVSSRFFFVMRSNVPQTTLTQLLDYSPFAPRCNLMIRTHYHE